MDKVLSDIRVVDLTHVWFGPWCTRILAMLGAEVIKIEPPWGGFIRYQPPLYGDASSSFLCLNAEKKGMTINLKKDKGRKIFLQLIDESDVVVNNFMPGTMEKLGISYDTLSTIKPSIIYAQLSGFGLTGPWSRRPSFASIGEAYSGYTRLNGDLVDSDGPPLPTTDAFGDLVPGTWAALSIIAALRHRDMTGEGQLIDATQIEICTHMVTNSINTLNMTGMMPWQARDKFRGPGVGGIIKASDGYVRVSAFGGAHVDRVTKMMNVEQATSENFREWVSERTVDEVVETLIKNDIPVAPIDSIEQALVNPHLKARNFFVEIDEPRAPEKKLVLPNFPVMLSKTPGRLTKRAPMLGEHNEEILTTLLGYSKEDIEKLRNEKVVT